MRHFALALLLALALATSAEAGPGRRFFSRFLPACQWFPADESDEDACDDPPEEPNECTRPGDDDEGDANPPEEEGDDEATESERSQKFLSLRDVNPCSRVRFIMNSPLPTYSGFILRTTWTIAFACALALASGAPWAGATREFAASAASLWCQTRTAGEDF